MKRSLWFLIGACMCVSVSAYASTWDKLDAALNELARRSGTTVDRLRVDPAVSALENDRVGTLRLEKYLMTEPERAPATLDGMVHSLGVGPSGVSHIQGVTSRLEVFSRLSWERTTAARPLDVEMVKLPTDKSSNPVEGAMKRLYAGTGRRFQGKDRTRVIEDSNKFPPELRAQVASLIDAVSQASRMRESVVKSSELKQGGAFEGKSHKTANLLRDFLNRWWEAGLSTDPKMSRLTFALETFDLDALYAGAIPLARSLDTAADRLSNIKTQGSIHADWQTPLGRIAVGGGGSDTYDGPYALIVDVGGNDVYRGPGAASGQEPVALVLDLGGDDRYAADDSAEAGPGGAVLGYAGIVDAGTGKDTYEATSWAGGFGCLGVGWIDDKGGDDVYRMQLLSQGCALFGIGLLLDEDGQDRFILANVDSAFASGQSQGFGGPLGIGALIDLEGGDTYVDTDSSDVLDLRPQGYVQGAAWGGAGRQWSGGFGLLLDADGHDVYRSRSFAQGVGVNSGLGVLVDYWGDDEYFSKFSSQGNGLVSGAGILYDAAGNDHYRSRIGVAMGIGMDLGLGMLLEGSGDDVYAIEGEGEGISVSPGLGSACGQGAGWLIDMEGTDTYPESRNEVFDCDWSSSWRPPVPAVSVFIDAGQPGVEATFTPPGGTGPALGGMLILLTPNAAGHTGSP